MHVDRVGVVGVGSVWIHLLLLLHICTYQLLTRSLTSFKTMFIIVCELTSFKLHICTYQLLTRSLTSFKTMFIIVCELTSFKTIIVCGGVGGGMGVVGVGGGR